MFRRFLSRIQTDVFDQEGLLTVCRTPVLEPLLVRAAEHIESDRRKQFRQSLNDWQRGRADGFTEDFQLGIVPAVPLFGSPENVTKWIRVVLVPDAKVATTSTLTGSDKQGHSARPFLGSGTIGKQNI